MEFFKIVLICIAASITYGIIHDQVTAHICVEYFSVAHPRVLPFTSPTLLAFQWGVLATWWVGAGLGLGLAASARMGSRTPLSARDLRTPIAKLLFCMALAALLSGLLGFCLAKTHVIALSGWLALVIPPSKHPAFLADWWAHSAAYLAGIVGGMFLCILAYRSRRCAQPL